ncbi:ATP-dependent DNA helicase RecG [uncultured Treponema sp.]|uniref:ATP-dependent DNA helicase RecG n=1 Tax=uncultured Treponema sp. TaxID=162155 RepID=UPI0025EF17E6|nr:ATP-dependent DNA helicase RecG [uncultured Treponema sp.]
MILSELGAAVETLSGVGPAAAKKFASLNIFTVADLLSVFPRDYEDRTKRIQLRDYANFPKVHTICKVTAHQWFGYGKMKTLKIAITDGSANAWLVAFNRDFLAKSLPEGSIIAVTGKFETKYNELQSSSFEATRISFNGNLEDFESVPVPDSAVIPIYPLTEGLTQKVYRKTVAQALKQYAKNISNEIPEQIIKERNLLNKSEAILFVHKPQNLNQAQEARKTLIYEELYLFEYKMLERALMHRGTLPSQDFAPEAYPYFSTPDSETGLEQIKDEFQKSLSPRQKKIFSSLNFELTLDQMNSILEMNRDIDKSQTECNTMLNAPQKLSKPPFSMQRLLQGDVGSGKTLVSFFVCARTIDYGGQCAILAPTELLARQHAENAAKLLEPAGIRTAFLTGNLKASGRQPLLNALRDGNIDIVIGTHALFSRNTQYKNLQLAVIDEQHKFGVTQRESIISKGRISFKHMAHSPDLLMMSATPIPQTLALTAFGDLDISVIKTMPKGRLPVKTYLTVFGNERNVYEAIRKKLNAGHQAYFVYPRIAENPQAEQTEKASLKSAEEMFDFLSKEVYPNFKCALIHGKTEDEQQAEILKNFSSGNIQVLVATTVVEVGVDVPNATCIAIEHAERFGLAELHQLRGRVGRGKFQSYCFLTYSKNITEAGISRLKALHQSNDGFFIAEEDLKLRGPGEVFGTAQSGYFALNIADLSRDKEILKTARYDALCQLKQHNP